MIQGRQQSVSELMTRCMCRGWKGCQGERLEHRDSSVCLAALSQPRWRPSVSHLPPACHRAAEVAQPVPLPRGA